MQQIHLTGTRGDTAMKTQTRRSTKVFSTLVSLALALTLLPGCHGGKDKGGITPMDPGLTSAGPEGRDTEALPDIDLDGPDFLRDRSLKTVYFAYDSAALDAPALSDLRAAAELLKTAPNALIQIAGHCDERGTQEYNLALGERRAQSVRNYLRQLGVPGDRLITLSFGEESPADPGNSESAWAKNRRCEFARAQSL